jgi:hypothetical protein
MIIYAECQTEYEMAMASYSGIELEKLKGTASGNVSPQQQTKR